jgi:hypothetical protein
MYLVLGLMPPYHIEIKVVDQEEKDAGGGGDGGYTSCCFSQLFCRGCVINLQLQITQTWLKINNQQELFCFKFGGKDKKTRGAVA